MSAITIFDLKIDMSESASLWSAAKAGNADEVDNILSNKQVDVNAAHQESYPTIEWASNFSRVIKYIKSGPQLDVSKDRVEGYVGSTPLWAAADGGYKEVVKLLLAHPSIQVNETNNDGLHAQLHQHNF